MSFQCLQALEEYLYSQMEAMGLKRLAVPKGVSVFYASLQSCYQIHRSMTILGILALPLKLEKWLSILVDFGQVLPPEIDMLTL